MKLTSYLTADVIRGEFEGSDGAKFQGVDENKIIDEKQTHLWNREEVRKINEQKYAEFCKSEVEAAEKFDEKFINAFVYDYKLEEHQAQTLLEFAKENFSSHMIKMIESSQELAEVFNEMNGK